MRGVIRNRFTIYDAMEAKGIFSANPANSDSFNPTEGTSLYEGPVEYPKMMYHPEGLRRVIVPGELLRDANGEPRLDRSGREIVVNQQDEIIWQMVHSEGEESKLRDAGWHDHPAKAIAAAGGEAPPISSAQRIDDLEAQLKRAQAELDKAKAASPVRVTKRDGAVAQADL